MRRGAHRWSASAVLLAVAAAAGLWTAAPPATAVSPAATATMADRDPMADGPIGQADQLKFPANYVDRVQAALREGTDTWGEQLMALPNGPTLDNTRDLLVPPNHGDDYWHDSRSNYLPLTYPMPNLARFSAERDFSFPFLDGSQINSDFADSRTRQWAKFYVGEGSELFGSAENRLDPPTLADGYLPILQNRYTDRQGRTYERESYVTRLSSSARLMTMMHFRVQQGSSAETSATLRVNLNGMYVAGAGQSGNNLVVGDKLSLAHSAQATWSAPDLTFELDLSQGAADVYLLLMNQPQALGTVVMDRGSYDARRAHMVAYWKKQLEAGSTVQIPERYAADAMRSMLLTNLVMGYNLTIGNGYELPDDERFAWIPEAVATVGSLGDFGFTTRTRQAIDQFLVRGQYNDGFTTWERGIKLQTAARYYLQSGDASLISDNLPNFRAWLADITAQRSQDPDGLLAKTRLYSDNSTKAHGIHHHADVWRGLRDMGLVLRLLHHDADAAAFTAQAQGLQAATMKAIERSSTELPDGSVFVPIALQDPSDFDPSGRITDSQQGSYWNLIMPYALGSGLIDPDSRIGKGLRTYLNTHGGLFLGLTRFNLSGEPVEACQTRPGGAWPAADGYRSSGIDQQYGWSYLKYLSQVGDADRIGLTFYGMLSQGFTPNTFIGGEGVTVAPCPMEFYRSQFRAPLSANNATYLKALSGMLLNETHDIQGMPNGLEVAPATPKLWLADGQTVGVTNLPTSFGPMTYAITSRVAKGTIEATVVPPAAETNRPELQRISVHLRVPAGYRITSATVNGAPVIIDGDAVSVPTSGRARVRAVVARASADLGMLVETSGTGVVKGRVIVVAPSGWTVAAGEIPFARNAGNGLAWQRVSTSVTAPRDAAVGRYPLTVTVHPQGGTPTSHTTSVAVSRPAPGTYADLVRADGAVGYWPLEDTAGTASDASGHGNDGQVRGTVVTGQPGPLAGEPSRSMSLAGGYIDVPSSPTLNLTGPYTLEAWVYPRESGDQGVLEKYDRPANNGYLLRLGARNRPEAMNLSDTLSTTGPAQKPVLQWGWRHLVSVFDGSTLTVYLDGEPLKTVPMTRAPSRGEASLKIGARGDDAGNRFVGWMADVAVYDRALSSAQIAAHHIKGTTVAGPSTAGGQ